MTITTPAHEHAGRRFGTDQAHVSGTWTQVVDKARRTWRTLKNDDFDVPYGDPESLARHIQKKTGQTMDFVYRKLFETSSSSDIRDVYSSTVDAENGVKT